MCVIDDYGRGNFISDLACDGPNITAGTHAAGFVLRAAADRPIRTDRLLAGSAWRWRHWLAYSDRGIHPGPRRAGARSLLFLAPRSSLVCLGVAVRHHIRTDSSLVG